MRARIGEFAKHLFYVGFRKRQAHGGISLHFSQTPPDFLLLRLGQGRWLLDFIPVFVKPSGEFAPLLNGQRQHL